MPDRLLIYYYFLEEDEACFSALQDRLISKGWAYANETHLTWPDEISQPIFYELNSDNARALVLYCTLKEQSWPEMTQELTQWEEQAGIDQDNLLGKVQVLITDRKSWQLAQDELNQDLIVPPLSFELMDGKAWRGIQSRDRVFYLAHFPDLNLRHARFFGEYLPLIELTVIRLQMLSRLMRDRGQVVTRERIELDRRLDQVLHMDLVEESQEASIIDTYEKHLDLMSSGYGKLVNNFSLILEGYQRLTNLLEVLRHQLAQEPSFAYSDVTGQQIFLPFEQRVAKLSRTLDELRLSRENHQAAIEVIRSRIDLLMSKENIATQTQIRTLMETNTAIQKQSLTFQFAAGLIEFIILAYYSHSLWKSLVPGAYHAIASWIQLLFVIAFSANTVYLTHLIAEYLQGEKHVKKQLQFSLLVLVIIILVVLIASAIFQKHALP
jgi:two-component sensor histidine kinase